MIPELIQAGRNYIQAGLTIIPVNARKKPAIVEWKSFENGRRTSLEDIEKWSKMPLACGWAVVCGAPSGNVYILDFDVPGFYEKWAALVGDLAGKLPTQQTGSGDGRQVAFISSLNLRNDKLAYAPAENKEGREIAIESRATGGYAVLPPSFCPQAKKRGIPHKQAYKTLQGDFTKIPTIPPEEALRLIEAARSLCQAPLSKRKMQAAPLPPRSNGGSSGGGVISSFNEFYEVGAILARNGYQPRGVRYLAEDSTTGEPGVHIFPDTGRCYSHHGNDPLNDGHSHDPFSVFCILEHGGDVKAAVKAAAEALGLERPQAPEPLPPDWRGEAKPQPQAWPESPQVAPSPRPAPLRFPDEVMTGAAGRFARTYSEYLETPRNFLYMAYLTLLGHVISDRITLKSEITPQPRLFTVLLGESADVRKSTSISKAYGFFKDTISADDLNVVWGAGSGEGLAKSFKNNNRVLLLLDELKAIIQKMRIESSSLLPCINTLFESNIFHNSTKKQNIAIDDGHLCMLAASTLDTYQNMFTGTFTDIGFINRLFIVIGDSERKFSIPEQIPPEAKAELKQDLRNVLTIVDEHSGPDPWPFPMNSTARDLFDAWYFQLEPSIFAKRLDAYGHRLMPLLAANEGEHIITPETAEKTLALLDYQLKARKLADPIDCDNKIARVEETIRRKLAPGPLQKRELERKVNKARMGVWAWDQAIKNLSDDHQVVWDFKNGTYHLAN
jgi:hypothetical protein